jgi:uncharacterized protein Yka (UPF0111/DUF47 family)
MAKEKPVRIIIKKGSFNLEVDRSDLVEVNETHDGVAFNFKDGLQLYYTDNFMPQGMKEIIKNTSNHFSGKKLIFDLDNQKHPAMVDAT